MKSFARTLRFALLAWSVLLASQLGLIHGYSHTGLQHGAGAARTGLGGDAAEPFQTAGERAANPSKEPFREPVKEAACGLCLSIHSFDAFLPAAAPACPAPLQQQATPSVSDCAVLAVAHAAPLARGPPTLL